MSEGRTSRVAMKVPEAARWFGMSKTAMYRAIRAGQFPAKNINGTIWISPAEVERWMATSDEVVTS